MEAIAQTQQTNCKAMLHRSMPQKKPLLHSKMMGLLLPGEAISREEIRTKEQEAISPLA